MNDTLKRRLVGLLVLLVLVFVLSWLLPDSWPESGEKGVPSTTLPLTANGLDGAAPTSSAEATAPADATATTPVATSPTVASAAPAHAAALPESVDAVDASAPPLSENAPASPSPAAPKPKPPAPNPAAATKPEAKPAPTPAPKAPEQKPAQIAPPAAKPQVTPPVAQLPQPAPPKPVVAPPVPAAPKLPAAVPPPPPPIVSSAPAQARLWFVQIGSFADQGNAQTTLNLLQNIGYRGEAKAITSASGSALYRVRLGPFPSEAVAQQAFDKVSHQGYPQARVVSEAGAVKH